MCFSTTCKAKSLKRPYLNFVYAFQPENINIKVIGRSRPLTPEEVNKGAKSVVKVSGDKISVESGGKVTCHTRLLSAEIMVRYDMSFQLVNKIEKAQTVKLGTHTTERKGDAYE